MRSVRGCVVTPFHRLFCVTCVCAGLLNGFCYNVHYYSISMVIIYLKSQSRLAISYCKSTEKYQQVLTLSSPSLSLSLCAHMYVCVHMSVCVCCVCVKNQKTHMLVNAWGPTTLLTSLVSQTSWSVGLCLIFPSQNMTTRTLTSRTRMKRLHWSLNFKP